MKRKRKTRALQVLLGAACLCAMAGCGNEADVSAPGDTADVAVNTEEDKILIVYFTAAENSGVDASSSASYSMIDGDALGRVQAIAQMIQEQVGGDLFSIRTQETYPADGEALIDAAAVEQEEGARPVLTTHIEDLDAYDTIFIGYPNWWADLPMPLYSFFDEYDLAGKTIIPFNVHNGSQFSRTIETIEELEPQARVITDGLSIRESDVEQAEQDVRTWLDGLGFSS